MVYELPGIRVFYEEDDIVVSVETKDLILCDSK